MRKEIPVFWGHNYGIPNNIKDNYDLKNQLLTQNYEL